VARGAFGIPEGVQVLLSGSMAIVEPAFRILPGLAKIPGRYQRAEKASPLAQRPGRRQIRFCRGQAAQKPSRSIATPLQQ
jgi:hypothetical protein